jgi:hypothetical protein
MCVDKSSCKAALEKQQLYVHMLTKDSFKKAYQENQAGNAEKSK